MNIIENIKSLCCDYYQGHYYYKYTDVLEILILEGFSCAACELEDLQTYEWAWMDYYPYEDHVRRADYNDGPLLKYQDVLKYIAEKLCNAEKTA